MPKKSEEKERNYSKDEIRVQFMEDGRTYGIRFVGDKAFSAMDKLADFIADLMQPKNQTNVQEMEANHEPANN